MPAIAQCKKHLPCELMKDPETERLIAQTQKAVEQSRREIEHYKQVRINSQQAVEESEKRLNKLLEDLRGSNTKSEKS